MEAATPKLKPTDATEPVAAAESYGPVGSAPPVVTPTDTKEKTTPPDGPTETDTAETTTPDGPTETAPATDGAETVPPGPPPAAEPVPPLDGELAALRAEVSGLRALTETLRADFAEKIRYDEVKERQFTDLHSEVQEHRRGLHQRLLRPVIDDLIRMHDDLREAIDAGIAARPADADQTFASFLDSVLEALSRCGVERREPLAVDTPGGLAPVVDRTSQRVVRSVPTENPDLDRRIARRRRDGFDYDGRVLRPAWVEAYRYTPPAEPADGPEPTVAAGDAATVDT